MTEKPFSFCNLQQKCTRQNKQARRASECIDPSRIHSLPRRARIGRKKHGPQRFNRRSSSGCDLGFFAFDQPQQDRAGDEDRTVGSDQNADDQGKRKRVDAGTAECVQQNDHDQRRHRCQQRSAERLVDAGVDHFARQLSELCLLFHEFGQTRRSYRSANNQ